MDLGIEFLLKAIFQVLALAVLILVIFRSVTGERKRGRSSKIGKGLQAFGAAMMLFGFGSPKDPVNEIIEQAEKSEQSEEDSAGDPPAT